MAGAWLLMAEQTPLIPTEAPLLPEEAPAPATATFGPRTDKLRAQLNAAVPLQPREAQFSVFHSALPGTKAAKLGKKPHPLTAAAMDAYATTMDMDSDRLAGNKQIAAALNLPVELVDAADPAQAKQWAELPKVRSILEKATASRRVFARDQEVAGILRGEVDRMYASEMAIEEMKKLKAQSAYGFGPDVGFFGEMATGGERGYYKNRASINAVDAAVELTRLAIDAQAVEDRDKSIWQIIEESFRPDAPSMETRELPTIGEAIVGGLTEAATRLGGKYVFGELDDATREKYLKSALTDLQVARRWAGQAEKTAYGPAVQKFLSEAQGDDSLEGYFKFFRAAQNNPAAFATFLSALTAEQAGPMLATAAATGVARRLGGPILARKVGTFMAGVTSFAQEALSVDSERMAIISKEVGYDIASPNGLERFTRDVAAQRKLVEFGFKRGGVIAAVEMLSLGTLHNVTSIAKTKLGKFTIATAQNMTTGMLSEALALRLTGQKLNAFEILVEGFAEASPANVALEMAISGASRFKQRVDANKAKAWLKGQTDLGGKIQGIPEAKLTAASEVLADKLKEDGIEAVHIPAAEVLTFDQDGSLAETLGLDPSALAQAAAEGGDVEISTPTYIRHILGKEGFEQLYRHTRFEPEGMTVAEAEEYEASGTEEEIEQRMAEKVMQRLGPRIDAEGLSKLNTDAGTIRAQVARQLEETGRYNSDRADSLGRLTAQRYVTRAIRITEATGKPVDALRLFNEDGLSILGGQSTRDTSFIDQAAIDFGVSSEQLRAELDAAGGEITATPSFKNWFGDSKVVDENGKPLVVYHGTYADIAAFDPDEGPYRGGLVAFVTTSTKFANDYATKNDGANVMPVYVKIENPFDFREGGRFTAEAFYEETGGLQDQNEINRIKIGYGQDLELDSPSGPLSKDSFADAVMEGRWDALEAPEFVEWLQASGYDGVVLMENGAINYGVFEPTQIKSVNNQGTFDANDPRILYQRALEFGVSSEQLRAELDAADGDIRRTPAFTKWFLDSKVVDDNGDPLVVYHGTTAGFDAFRGLTFFAENPDEASAYTFWGDMLRAGQMRSRNHLGEADPALVGSRVPYIGIIGDIPYQERSGVWATDNGVVRFLGKESYEFVPNVVVEYNTAEFQQAEGRENTTILLVEGDGKAPFDRQAQAIEEHIQRNYMERGAGGRVIPAYLSIQNPLILGPLEANKLGQRLGVMSEAEVSAQVQEWKDQGYDGIKTTSDEAAVSPELFEGQNTTQWIAFDPTQIKSVHNRGTFDANDPRILYQDADPLAKPDPRMADGTQHKVLPHLRAYADVEVTTSKKEAMKQDTNNKNARSQLAKLDRVLAAHPDAHTSEEAWTAMLADAFGMNDVPMPPYRFIKDINGEGSQQNLARLSPGQIEDANHGFENAAKFRAAYISGQLGVDTTGKLFLWSFLSRGVSPYTQESLFIDAFDGIDKWMAQAAAGTFDVAAYSAWVKTVAPAGSGKPGAGSTHNLNAFGKDFLVKMSMDVGDGTGRSRLQYLHDLMSDPQATGQQVRREFATFGEGVGIDNKVVSFTLLVAGFDDVLVLDRVQFRQMYDDGRFAGINLYDGFKKAGKVVNGSSFADQGDGVRGLLLYEAMERAVAARVDEIYTGLGREGQGSVGRYHWETWVADSAQEASHGSISAILPAALGDKAAISGVTAKQGEYGSYAYGARYGVDGSGTAFFTYGTPSGKLTVFTVDQFVAFQAELKKPKNGVIPAKFKVTESGNAPWYTREEVSVEALDKLADLHGSGEAGQGQGTVRRDGKDEALPSGRPAADPAFEQRGSGDARGGFTPSDQIVGQDGKTLNLIQIFESADASTFLHESGHFWLEQLKADAQSFDGPFKADFSTVTNWWQSRALEIREEAVRRAKKAGEQGVVSALQAMTEEQVKAYVGQGDLRGDGSPAQRFLSVAMHEQFARGVESYFANGTAPSLTLADLFAQFAAWIRSVYRTLKRTDVEFSPEVSGVMDRMLATDDEITTAEGQYEMAALADDAAQLGMTEAQFTAFQKDIKRRSDQSKANHNAKKMADLQRARTQWWKEERERFREDVEREVGERPLYRLVHTLATGGRADGAQAPAGENLGKMNRKLLLPFLEAAGMTYAELPTVGTAQITATGSDLIDPGVVASVYGFDDPGHMVRELRGLPKFEVTVEAEIESRMEAEHGSVDLQGQEEATASIHGDHAAKVMMTELTALRTTEPAFKPQFIKAYAQNKINRMRAADVRPYKFLVAERRSAQAAKEALRKGDKVTAYKHQFQRLVNHQIAMVAINAEKDTIKQQRYMRKFKKKGAKFRNIEARYVDRIKAAVSMLDFDAPVSERQRYMVEMKALHDFFVDAQQTDGAVFKIPRWLEDKDRLTNVREMTHGEFVETYELVRSLEKQGRLAKKLRRGKEQRDRQQLIAEMRAKLSANPVALVNRLRDKFVSPSAQGLSPTAQRATALLASTDAQLLKVEPMLEAIDGEPLGVWHQTIYQPFADADARKNDLTKEVSLLIEARLKALPKAVRKALGKSVDVGALGVAGQRWTRGELLMLATNVGNESNLTKLIEGYKEMGWNISEPLIDTALAKLTKEEWDLVQAVWDHADKLWPSVEAIYREENGVAPERVEPRTVVTPHGDYRGGYFPMLYDHSYAGGAAQARNAQRTALEVMQGRAGRASVNSSMTKGRTGYAAPVLLDITRLTEGFDTAIHYITHYDAIRNALKVLNDENLRNDLELKVGKAYAQELDNWVAALASNGGDNPPMTKLEQTAQKLISNTTVTALALSYTTLTAQTFGLFTSLDRLIKDNGYGPISAAKMTRHLARGMRLALSPDYVKGVMAVSGEMRYRVENTDRDLRAVLKTLQRKGEKTLFDRGTEFSMRSIALVQFHTVDVPTWIAAYNYSLEQEPTDIDRAVKYADRVVRLSQSSGSLKDLAAIQRKQGLIKAATMFYTFFSGLYAILRGVGKDFSANVRAKPVRATMEAATRVFIVVTLQEMASALVRGKLPDWEPEDEDEDGMLMFMAKSTVTGAISTVPLVRDLVEGLFSEYGYSGSAAGMFGDSLAKASKEIQKGMDPEQEADWSAVDTLKPLIIIGGVLTGKVPGVQINRTLDGLEAMWNEDYEWRWWDNIMGYDEKRAEKR
jgi:hypothetical protein